MIIKLLFQLVTGIINLIPFSLPGLPDGVAAILDTFKIYLMSGMGMIKSYTHWNYLTTLLVIVIAMDGVFYGYKFVMWIIRKIPALSIKD